MKSREDGKARRAISAVLSLLLVVSTCPTSAIAEALGPLALPASAVLGDAKVVGNDDTNMSPDLEESMAVEDELGSDVAEMPGDSEESYEPGSHDASDSGLKAVADTETPEVTDGWAQADSCEWHVDEMGCLVLRPLGNGAQGRLKSNPRWVDSGATSFRCEGRVSVDSFDELFSGCSSLVTINLSNIELEDNGYASFRYAFADCKSLETVNFGTLDASNVKDFSSMFYACESLSGVDLSSLNLANAAYLDGMFSGCKALKTLDFHAMLGGRVELASGMFAGCSSLRTVSFEGVDLSSMESMESMFAGCANLADVDLSDATAPNLTAMDQMFQDCTSLASINLSNFIAEKLATLRQMFYGCSALSSIKLDGFYAPSLKDLQNCFSGCSSLTEIEAAPLFAGQVEDIGQLFSNCYYLSSVDADAFDVSHVRNMSGVFNGDESLRGLDLSQWNTSNVTSMSSLFSGCASLEKLNINNWDTSNVTNFSGMFRGCSSLENLDISSFDTARASNLGQMFDEMTSLRSVSLGTSFSFSGLRPVRQCALPSGANEVRSVRWTNETGQYYAAEEVPSNVRATYQLKYLIGPDQFEFCSATYSGNPIEPDVKTSLKRGVDYELSFSENINAGEGMAHVIGIGEYVGSFESAFVINKAIPQVERPGLVEAKQGQTLSGIALPNGWVWDNPDAIVSPSDGFVCGWTATYVPDDTSNFETLKAIVPVHIASSTYLVDPSLFSVDPSRLVYDGAPKCPAVTSEVVPAGSYSVSYSDNVDAGEGLATVTGCGLWSGSCELRFEIAKAPTAAQAPSGVSALSGQRLFEVALPDGWSWDDPVAPVGDPGTRSVFRQEDLSKKSIGN